MKRMAIIAAAIALLLFCAPAMAAMLNGAGPPSNAIGALGDFYYDTAAELMYGPKTGPSWPSTAFYDGKNPSFESLSVGASDDSPSVGGGIMDWSNVLGLALSSDMVDNNGLIDTGACTRAGTNRYYVNSLGVLASSAANTAVFQSSGLSYSPGGENILTYSIDFTQWANVRTTDSGSKSDPAGGTSATDILESVDNNTHHIDSPAFAVSNGSRYVMSVFAKKLDRQFFTIDANSSGLPGCYATFDLDNGVVQNEGITTYVSSGMYQVGNTGWFLCWIVCDASGDDASSYLRIWTNEDATDKQSGTYIGDVTKGVTVFGAQVTVGYLLPYIPTTGEAASCAADALAWTQTAGGGALFAGSFTAVLDWTPWFNPGDISDDTAILALNGGADLIYCDEDGQLLTTDGTSVVAIDIDYTIGNTYRIAIVAKHGGQILLNATDGAGVWNTWASDAYDGAYAVGANMQVAPSATAAMDIKNVVVFNDAKTTMFVESNF
jgi:hypothetical protein